MYFVLAVLQEVELADSRLDQGLHLPGPQRRETDRSSLDPAVINVYTIYSFQFFNHKLYNKIAFFPTIIISAVYHEYVIWAPMRFVLPVLLAQFGVFGGM